MEDILADLDLNTVCTEAQCPNRHECFARGTATFMILGRRCSRNCRFCAVATGPQGALRQDEPEMVAEAARLMELKHVVVTSVTRDDLPDGGSGHFARTIAAIRREIPTATVEVLTPDFGGDEAAVETVIGARPDVFNHNVETAPRLYPAARPQANYRQSLDVLEIAKKLSAGRKIFTKSGFMVGLGETDEEVIGIMRDLRDVGCDMLTIGQYLSPSGDHLPVDRYVRPEKFEQWTDTAKQMGFRAVSAGPFVRSSHRAGELLRASTNR